MLIAVDTNIWRSERLFRTASGMAFLRAIKRLEAKILLTWVTKEEVINVCTAAVLDAQERILRSSDLILTFTGAHTRFDVLIDEDIKEKIEERLFNLKDLLYSPAVLFEHHERSLNRILKHTAPSRTKEQHRDGLMWEALVEAVEEDKVIITDDGDFTDTVEGLKTLAEDLRKESEGNVALFTDISAFLDAYREKVPSLDRAEVSSAILPCVLQEVEKLLSEREAQLGGAETHSLKLYPVDDPDKEAVFFTYIIPASGLKLPDSGILEDVYLRCVGSCLLTDNGKVDNFQMNTIDAYGLDGFRRPGGMQYVSIGFEGREKKFDSLKILREKEQGQ